MMDWWYGLTILQQILLCFAVPATLVLVLQTILLLIGMGSGADGLEDAPDLDADFDSDGLEVSDGGLRVFTVRGVVAFLAVGGWFGLALLEWNASEQLAVVLAVLGGFVAMVLIALMLKGMLRLQDSGNLSLQNAVGLNAKVYLSVPAGRSGSGKVTLTVQERFIEVSALTDADAPLPTGSLVIVVGTVGEEAVLVAPSP